MTSDRFQFQRQCLYKVSGKVLNVGCKEDPAGLRELSSRRVVNLDRYDYDEDLYKKEGRRVPIPVDVLHDILVFPWPFKDGEFDLVILGDILEDLQDDGCQMEILKEAHRISTAICITTPEDSPERDDHHQTTITEKRLREWLSESGWEIESLEVVDYGFVPRGYYVFARR